MVTKAQLDEQKVKIEQLRSLIITLQEKVANLERKQESYEQKAKCSISETSSWAKVLTNEVKKNEYHTNILNVVGIEQKARKQKERNVMVFGIPTSEMFVAAEISKAAKCLKDNQDFKSVDINPGLTQSQQIHLKRLLKESIYKKPIVFLYKKVTNFS
jgi:hypothetical protein